MSQTTIRLTMAQAVARFLRKQMTVINGETLPTYRGQNEQGMANAAIAVAKASFRRRFMACTTSIGPGALNRVTSAALAHVNRLPILLWPGHRHRSAGHHG